MRGAAGWPGELAAAAALEERFPPDLVVNGARFAQVQQLLLGRTLGSARTAADPAALDAAVSGRERTGTADTPGVVLGGRARVLPSGSEAKPTERGLRMTTRLMAALVAAILLMTGAAGVTAATAVTATADAGTAVGATAACADELEVLRSDVAAVPISSGKVDKERAGLVKLVDDATALVAGGKTADTLVKLGNLRTKVGQLAEGGRISPESAALLTADIDAASGCLSAG